MATIFMAGGASGAAAIYDGPDDAPFADPDSYEGRVRFHTAWGYLPIIGIVTGSLALPARNTTSATSGFATFGWQIFAHGQSGGIPMVDARWVGAGLSGADVPAVGSVPVQGYNGGLTGTIARWLTLGADATYVYVHEGVDAGAVTLPAITIAYEIYILDKRF